MSFRERRTWTEFEDKLLRSAVQQEDADSHPPTKWRAIAKHIPNRNNKDCRKRWFAKMASPVARGGWSADEDDRLVKAIQKYGTRWSSVAAIVGTRNNNQCAKRWTDTLSPDIDRTAWAPEEDAQLLAAVAKQGTLWAQIVKMHFPGRTGLSAKNRYARLSRTPTDLIDGDRHHHTRNRRLSSSLCETFLVNRSLSRPAPSPDYSDTTSTPGSSSSSLIIDQPSQTPEQGCPKFVTQLEDDLLGLQRTSFQFPSYCSSKTSEKADEALTFSGTDLFWGNRPSTMVPDFLHPQMGQRQGFNCHPYEAMNEVGHFVASNPWPSQTLNGGAQPASHLPSFRLFDDKSSLYPQPAYSIPSTINLSHTPQLRNTSNIRQPYGTNDIQVLPSTADTPPSTLITPSFPLRHDGTPDFSLFTLPTEVPVYGPASEINGSAADLIKKLGNDAQDMLLSYPVADRVIRSTSQWDLGRPCSCTIPSLSDADVGLVVERGICCPFK